MEKIIDIHTHLFNLKYLPIAGILVRRGGGIISPRIALSIEKALVNSTKSEFDDSQKNSAKIMRPAKDFLNLSFFEVIDEISNEVPTNELLDPVVIEGLEEFQEIALSEKFITLDEAVNFTVLRQKNLIDMDTVLAFKLGGLFRRMLEWVCSKVSALVNYIKWFRFMMQSEVEILKCLITKDGLGIDLYIHHLMDVDYYFNSKDEPHKYKSRFNYATQIDNMSRLNRMYKDKVYGFVAFDPSKKDCVEIVKDAIDNKGFRGVKFYPPMGYQAYNDPVFKNQIEQFLDYCVANDVAIFTHCNNKGFEAFPKENSGHKSNPKFWNSVLEQPKYYNLRLCLAHGGGGEGWFAENKIEDQIQKNQITDLIDENQHDWNSSYAKIVYRLCLVYPNVYCDVAYLDEITELGMYTNLRNRLSKLFNAEPQFARKIIYGSDWHMLFQEGKNNNYIENYKRLFNEPEFTEEQRRDFFQNNALSYLKLKK